MIAPGAALGDVVSEARAHVMDLKIAIEIHWDIAQAGRKRGRRGGQSWSVTEVATNRVEDLLPVRNRS